MDVVTECVLQLEAELTISFGIARADRIAKLEFYFTGANVSEFELRERTPIMRVIVKIAEIIVRPGIVKALKALRRARLGAGDKLTGNFQPERRALGVAIARDQQVAAEEAGEAARDCQIQSHSFVVPCA